MPSTNSIKRILTIRVDLLLFLVFIITIPFEKRHIFNLSTATIGNSFIEWKAISIYFSDIVFIFVILSWLIYLFILQYQKSAHKRTIPVQSINITPIIFSLSLFAVIAVTSTILANNNIAYFKLLKLFEGGLLFFFVIHNLSTRKRVIFSILAFVFSMFIQSLIAIFQFLAQSSLGLKIIGEPDASPVLHNIAKVTLDGNKYIRAFGTFPHANVLGGFMFVGFVLCIGLIGLFLIHKRDTKNVPRGTFSETTGGDIIEKKLLCSSKSLKDEKMFHVEHFPYLPSLSHNQVFAILILITFSIYTALMLSFSFSAYLALLLSPIIFLVIYRFTRKKCLLCTKRGLINRISTVNKRYLLLLLGVIVIITAFAAPYILSKGNTTTSSGEDFSIAGRVFYMETAWEMIRVNTMFGVGPGHYALEIEDYTQHSSYLPSWIINPVHNVPLLIASELGIICLFLFIFLLGWVIYRGFATYSKKELTEKVLVACFITITVGLIIIMQFDHYLWSLQQGFLLLCLSLGILTTLTTKLQK